DLGFVGEPETVNPRLLEVITDGDFIPVVAPLEESVASAGVTLPTVSSEPSPAPVETGDQLDVYNQIVCLQVDAKDDVKIDRVRFYWWDSVKGKYVELGVDEDPPFERCFDTAVLNLEFNQIFAEAYDNSGNISSRKWIWLYKVADARRLFLPVVSR
ncbi:MAG: hypothetical protein P8X95_20265, partial [Anaerolineales bacterium]